MKGNNLFVTVISLSLVLSAGLAFADDDDDDGYRFWIKATGIAPVTNSLYQEECGSCHFAYQPGLLPARSWEKVMNSLASHFGDNAEMSGAAYQQILSYLIENSADHTSDRRSKKIMRSIAPGFTPLRITDTPYIKHKHDEIPGRYITGNKNVSSLSRCDACHQNAQQGSYYESQVRIPGVGRWDD